VIETVVGVACFALGAFLALWVLRVRTSDSEFWERVPRVPHPIYVRRAWLRRWATSAPNHRPGIWWQARDGRIRLLVPSDEQRAEFDRQARLLTRSSATASALADLIRRGPDGWPGS
jgi:hypothetical protein